MDRSPWKNSPVVLLRGDLSLFGRPGLARELGIAETLSRVTLDARDVTYLGASAMGAFVRLSNQMGYADPPRIRLIVRSQHAALLRLVKLDSVFAIDDIGAKK